MARIQLVIDDSEREAFRAQARAAGQTLSEWLREAGRRRMADQRQPTLDSDEALQSFFSSIDRYHEQRGDDVEEPWESVKRRLAAERYAELDPLGIDA